jgi:hypothetical protein
VVALRLLQRRRQRLHPPAHVRRQRQVLHLHCAARSNAHRMDDDLHKADVVSQNYWDGISGCDPALLLLDPQDDSCH